MKNIIEKIKQYFKIKLVGNLLKTYKFKHEDIGELNKIIETDYFIISMPKCGTTSLKQGFSKLNLNVIQTHTNDVGYKSLTNGSILKKYNLSLDIFIKYRLLKSERPIYIFSGFREPIAWYLSLAQQFKNVNLDKSINKNIYENVYHKSPWKDYLPSIQFPLIEICSGINIFDYEFDKNEGIVCIKNKNINLILYRVDALSKLEKYISNNILRDYGLISGRINEDNSYLDFKLNFKLDSKTIEKLFDCKYMHHFYNENQIDNLKLKYMQ